MKNQKHKKLLANQREKIFLKEKIKKEVAWKKMPKTWGEGIFFDDHPIMKDEQQYILISNKKANKKLSKTDLKTIYKINHETLRKQSYNNKTVFIKQSNRIKRKEYKDIEKQIKNSKVGGEEKLFYTNCCVTDKNGNKNYSETSDLYDEINTIQFTFLDFYFLSRKHKNVFYNATISTSYPDALDLENSISFAKIHLEKIKQSEIEDKWDMAGYYQDEIERFNNGILTHPAMFAGYAVKHYDYHYGVGLHICIADKKSLTVEDIEQFILAFYENGEEEINPELEKWINYIRYPSNEPNSKEKTLEYHKKLVDYVSNDSENHYQSKIVGNYIPDFYHLVTKDHNTWNEISNNINQCSHEISLLQHTISEAGKEQLNNQQINAENEVLDSIIGQRYSYITWQKTHSWSTICHRFLACIDYHKLNQSRKHDKSAYQFCMWLYLIKNKHFYDLVNPELSIDIVRQTFNNIHPNLIEDFQEALDWWEKSRLSDIDISEQEALTIILDNETNFKKYFTYVVCAFAIAHISIYSKQQTCGKDKLNDNLFNRFWFDKDLHDDFLSCLRWNEELNSYQTPDYIQEVYNEYFGEYDIHIDMGSLIDEYKKRMKLFQSADNNLKSEQQRLKDLLDKQNHNLQEYQKFWSQPIINK